MLFLYVTNEGKVHKIPYPKGREFKPIGELANEEVLAVTLIFSIKNNLPYSFIDISFDRILLDSLGQYIQTDEDIYIKTRNYCTYSLVSAEELSKVNEPWVIPDAPIIPNDHEKRVIRDYLIHDYTLMWKRNEDLIEDKINLLNKRHKELINIIRRASIIRRKI